MKIDQSKRSRSVERAHELVQSSERMITESSEEQKKKVYFNIIENEEYIAL